jgi:hypothetical protein
MATTYASSASPGFSKRLRSGLPLIPCGKCDNETKIVMEYRVKKEGPNKGRIFYKCPDCNVSCLLAFDNYD